MDSVPVIRDLRFLQLPALPIIFEEEWHIPNSRDDDVLWSIVLAYLNSFSVSNKADVNLHGKRLLGKKVGKNFTKCVEKCNPFSYRNAGFNIEIQNNVVQTFRSRIDEFYQQNKRLFPFNHCSYICLQASSVLLSCNIILCKDSTNGVVKLFPDILPFLNLPKKLIIFVESFSFCIPKELGFEKQKQAFQEILLKTQFNESEHTMKNVIKRICALPDIRETFLISLLNSSFSEYIPYIYKSAYVLSKLRDAAIETSPTIENEEGKSALFIALTRSTSNLLYFLYDHAVNTYLHTQGSIRSPDPVIILNLVTIKQLLNALKEKLQSSDMDKNIKCKSLRNLKELCRFNNFQTDVCTTINNIRQRINYYEDISKKYEAEQRKEVIGHFLQSYKKYFEWDNSLMYDEFSLFKKFYKHGDYFDNLDFCSAIMFFDNLFLLKERLLLSDKLYLNIESQFFFFIYSKKYFDAIVDEAPNLGFATRLIIFNERLGLKNRLFSFKEALEKEVICDENVVNQLPESAVRTLVNIPQIYDEFLVLKLSHYLNAVTNINEINMKAILILQRTLQVIGECVKEIDFKSVQNILSLIFPDELVTNLKVIRKILSHPKVSELPYRKSAEDNFQLFRRIKVEIIKIKNILSPIFSAQKYAMDQYVAELTQRAISEVEEKEIPEIHHPYFMAILSSIEVKNQNIENTNFQAIWGKYIHEMNNWVSSKLTLNDEDKELITKTTVKQYNYIIKNIFCSLKKKINFMKHKSNSIQEAKRTMDRFFDIVEYLLSHIMIDNNFSVNNRRKLLERIVDRKIIFREFNAKQHDENKNSTSEMVVKEMKVCKHQDNMISGDPNCAKIFNSKQNFVAEHNEHVYNNYEVPDSVPLELISTEINRKIIEQNENFDAEDILSDCDFFNNEYEFYNSETENGANLFTRKTDYGSCEKFLEISEVDLPIPEERVVCERNLENNSSNNEHSNEKEKFYEAVEDILSDYENNTKEIFLRSNFENSKSNNFKFDNIEIFRKTLKGCCYLNGKEKELILQSIPDHIHSGFEAKNKVKSFLEKKSHLQLNQAEFDKEISKLPLKAKEKQELLDDFFLDDKKNSLSIVNSIHDHVQDLKDSIANNDLGKKNYDALCESLYLPDNSRDILGKIVQGQKYKVHGNQLEFLRDRIQQLKNILIDENKDIKQIWESANSPRKKSYVHEIIVHVYLNDSGIQASVEMLLFDCMNILKTQDLQNLCRKTTNLFNGINLRNVLAHGNPLLEYLGKLLDPTDLPAELVRKMLSLVSDLQIIDCMLEVINKTGSSFSNFNNFMTENQDGELKDLQEKMAACDKWKHYTFLIPRDECSDQN